MSVPPYQHVYLSPHLDDAVFSCGGAIALQRARGERVLVLTVCAGFPPEDAPAPPLLRDGLRAAGLTATDFLRLRREEDRRAASLLDIAYEWADGLDAIYRLPETYGTFAALSGEIAASDPLVEFANELVRSISPGALVYAPLGVGEHVDHRIVSAAAMQAGRRVLFYEDFPYSALDPEAVSRRIAALDIAVEPVLTDVSATLDRRIAATCCYSSQIALLGPMDALITTHARRVGGGTPAERTFGTRAG